MHVEGRHTSTKLSETFTELMVKWYCLHQNLVGGSQKLESSQNHVSKESIACGSEPADSDVALESAFFK